ncbi:MAG: hypothetical protein ACLFWG_10795, partial [Longimicrobiales bacterium]
VEAGVLINPSLRPFSELWLYRGRERADQVSALESPPGEVAGDVPDPGDAADPADRGMNGNDDEESR